MQALADKSFLVIGNDAASLQQSTIIAGTAPALASGGLRTERQWKVANKGSVAAVRLSFDTSGLGYAPVAMLSNYALMIDNDGDGDFSTGSISFFNANSSSGKLIYFDGVTLSDGIVFTIVTLKASVNLPATWLGFTAAVNNGNALLQWKTSEEINVDYYLVERSLDGVNYIAAGQVRAHNSTGVNNYTFTDPSILTGIHYYRIRRVDKNGTTALSSTRSIKISARLADVLVRPNPVAGSELSLSLTASQLSKTSLQLKSADGQLILQKEVTLVTGNNQLQLDIAALPAGVYLLQLQLNNELISRKFIRQR